MSRNVWLTFPEWELICNELSDQKYHSFQLNRHELKMWNESRKNRKEVYSLPEEPKCFSRVGVYPSINCVKSARTLNILCRENWRPQDMGDMMDNIHDFIGFILTHYKNVNMDTTLNEWQQICNNMKDVIDSSDKRYWLDNDLISLYQKQQLEVL